MRKIIFFIVLFFCVNVNAQSQLQFKQVLTAQIDTTWGFVAHPSITLANTYDFGLFTISDSIAIKINKIGIYVEDTPGMQTSSCSHVGYLVINGHQFELSDAEGLWLGAGDKISFRFKVSTPVSNSSVCYQDGTIFLNAIEYKVTPY